MSGAHRDPAFDFGEQPKPCAFIQWKGTDVCMDFYCKCGAHHHIDSYFVYAVQCSRCGSIWEMPQHIYPRRVDHHACIHVSDPYEEN